MDNQVSEGLSVLVPVYNWDCSNLLKELHRQGRAIASGFELLVADDCSSDLTLKEKVASTASALEGCRYFALDSNKGRAAIRNFLADNAVYDKLLFIDCDAETDSDTFLAAYMAVAGQASVICGGLRHPDRLPAPGKELRYRYEKAADRHRSAKFRSRHPYDNFTPFSFLIDRSVFQSVRFDEGITAYGYEDVEFGMCLESRGVPILHIDNPLIHTGIDDNADYLAKTDAAVSTLLQAENSVGNGSKLLNTYRNLSRLHLAAPVRCLGRVAYPFIRRNLTGRHPVLLLFSFYKLYRLALLDYQTRKTDR